MGLARFCYRRRHLVLPTWIVGVIAVAFAGFGYGAASDNDFSGGDSGVRQDAEADREALPRAARGHADSRDQGSKGIDDPAARQKIEKVIADPAASPITGPVTSPYRDRNLVTKDRRIARMTIPLTVKEAKKTEVAPLVATVSDDVLPTASGGQEVYLGGPNAGTADFADEVGSRLPLMIAVVQWGWFGSALGFPTAIPVTAWVPMIMFPVLFGLSMDYEVFLISRVREEYERTGDTRMAVTRGLARTAKVITAAAAIMIAVFTTSLLGPDVAVKQGGRAPSFCESVAFVT